MKLVTTLLLAATCSAFALDDGPIFQCTGNGYEGFMAISQSRGEARKTVSPHVIGASLESEITLGPEQLQRLSEAYDEEMKGNEKAD